MNGFTLLLWLHLMSIAVAGASTFGNPVLGVVAKSAAPEHRPVLIGAMRRLATLGRGALLVLLVTGPLLVWMKYGSYAGLSHWFSAKMGAVLLLVLLVIASGINAKRMAAGDQAARGRAPILGMAGIALLTLTVLFAVLAFG